MNIPSPSTLNDSEYVLPYVFVGDEAFALNTNLLRPYGGNELTKEQKIFNYRLTRARRYVECAFGIMANKWRILHRPLNVNIHLAEDIVNVTCLLQNFIHKEEGQRSPLAINQVCSNPIGSMSPLLDLEDHNMTGDEVRRKYTEYFSSDIGALAWQNKYA